jgi:hypothetical protein
VPVPNTRKYHPSAHPGPTFHPSTMSNPFYPVGGSSKASANQFSSNPYALGPPPGVNQTLLPANVHEYDIGMYEQASAYVPGAAIVQRGASGSTGGHLAARGGGRGKKTTVVRRGGGQTWEDPTLLEWDPRKYLIFIIELVLTLPLQSGSAFS